MLWKVSACLSRPRLFEVQFSLDVATVLVAQGTRVVELLHPLPLRRDQLPFQIAAPPDHVVGAVALRMPLKAS